MDKGNSVVLIEKQEYINKTNNCINENNFTPIEKDPTNKFQQQIKQLNKSFPKLFHDKNSMKMNENNINTLNNV